MSDTTTDPPLPPAEGMSSHMKALFALATIVMVMFFVMLMVLSFHQVPDPNKDLIDTLLGVLAGTGFGSVVSFFFGTSASSVTKDTTIHNLSAKP